jgi:ACR3 family arsenite efflux pump ArsB
MKVLMMKERYKILIILLAFSGAYAIPWANPVIRQSGLEAFLMLQEYAREHVLTPVTTIALLVTLVLLFSFKGDVILSNPLTIFWIAIPLFIQTNLIFWLGYALAKDFKELNNEEKGRSWKRPCR